MFDESLILPSAFFSLTDKTREDQKEIKNKIESISENLKTLKESPTREEGQFPRTVARYVRPVLRSETICLYPSWLQKTIAYPERNFSRRSHSAAIYSFAFSKNCDSFSE